MSHYTFHLVGLGLTVDVEADSERLAVLKIYDGLTEAQIFDLEWCDLIESDVSSFKAATDTADALWVACVCPFFCAWQWLAKIVRIK